MAHVEEALVHSRMTRRQALGALAAGTLAACSRIEPRPGAPEPPDAPREFRGAWVASVSNIDWPSRPGLPVEAQQQEARALVASARAIGLNALILQVRPAADALYDSRLEPWSEYLTGEQGRAPEPFYDPLAFWIEEAHRAGIELHAWFNPFRARHPSARGPLAANHVARAEPALVKSYGDMLWMDPGDPAAADRALAVIVDVVKRYDVDGVHVDDYFYPYPVKTAAGDEVAFPDEDSWREYHGPLARADWRRANIDSFVARMYDAVRAASAHVRVGISPFGIGRPDRRPEGVSGFSQYDAIFADVETWLANGWMDYLAPQLYWKRDTPGQQFAALLDYWNSQNVKTRHIWPGLFTSRIDASAESWSVEDIATEIDVARGHAARGHIHFSISALAQDRRGIAGRLRELYATPSLVPPTPWLSRVSPAPPVVDVAVDASAPSVVRIMPKDAPWRLAVWTLYGDSWRFAVLPAGQGALAREDAGRALRSLVVSRVDRVGIESVRVRMTPP
jgi:uncharacterized lipoprotein YddW (UPF0748 family)